MATTAIAIFLIGIISKKHMHDHDTLEAHTKHKFDRLNMTVRYLSASACAMILL
jgi:hypothetical protein